MSDISSSLSAFAFFLAAGLALRVVCVVFLGAGLAAAAFFGAALALGFCGMIEFSEKVSQSDFDAEVGFDGEMRLGFDGESESGSMIICKLVSIVNHGLDSRGNAIQVQCEMPSIQEIALWVQWGM